MSHWSSRRCCSLLEEKKTNKWILFRFSIVMFESLKRFQTSAKQIRTEQRKISLQSDDFILLSTYAHRERENNNQFINFSDKLLVQLEISSHLSISQYGFIFSLLSLSRMRTDIFPCQWRLDRLTRIYLFEKKGRHYTIVFIRSSLTFKQELCCYPSNNSSLLYTTVSHRNRMRVVVAATARNNSLRIIMEETRI